MSEIRDPAIKLFGKTIQILLPDDPLLLAESKSSSSSITPPIAQDCKKSSDEELTAPKREETSSFPSAEESSCMNEDPKTPTTDKEASSSANFNNNQKEDPPSDTSNNSSEEKPPKPDKILPCPRCNSMDTKFCYYNNYNVNQPRHFCKNCQRYWTAGGTMRNTPVGSGRRKNKSTASASHFRHVIVSEAAHQAAQAEAKTVLTFGPDVPLCESMASALNLAEKSQNDLKEPKSVCSDDSSMTSVSTDARSLKSFQGYHPLQVPCFPAPPWPYPWNPTQYRPHPTSFGPPGGFPVSFYPPPQYWGCTVQPLSPWAMPWLAPPNDGFTLSGSNPSSPLGKHSRDGNLLGPSENGTERESTVLIPKTLRINDPNDAAKSSVWSTLGIKNEVSSNTSLFKAFQPKGNMEKNNVQENSLVLQANPAALSRSLNFHESS